MDTYRVVKQYGHFVQTFEVKAESAEVAWDEAEEHGRLIYQTCYKELLPEHNYVVNLDKKRREDYLSKELYDEWLSESIRLGMRLF